MTINDLLNQAVAQHQAGALAAAEALHARILEAEPEFPESLHLLGVIAHQRGDNARAVDLIRRAIARKGTDAAFHSNLAVSLRALGRLDEAVAHLREAIRLAPDYAAGHRNLGVTLNQTGRSEEALGHLRRAVELDPRDAGSRRALGTGLLKQGRLAQAAEQFQAAVSVRPDDVEALNNLGVCLKELGRLDEAADALRRALDQRPDSIDPLNNLGTVLSMQRRLPEAEACFRKALAVDPEYPDALHNLGVVLRDMGRVDDGIACIHRAMARVPGDVEMYNNLGVAYQAKGDYDEAEACYERALRIRPDHVWARFNRSTLLLARGDFANGWLEYEWRWKRPGLAPRRFGRPLWDGTPAPGATLLVYAEQGLGDALQFARFAALARRHVGAVVLECQDVLLPILARCKGIDRFVAKGQALPAFDLHAPLLSLPGILGTCYEGIPADVPYVFPDSALAASWASRLKEVEGFKVGINWQGNPQFQRDAHRSMPLAHFAPLASVPGVRLVSLQWGHGREQLTDGSARFPVIDFGDGLDRDAGPFMDRAAIMQSLDLVVTSDTATAHLAGALGVPVWVALSLSPDWRWFRDGEACPWYPTMRLFRQRRLMDWDDVFGRIAVRLGEVIRGRV